MLGKGLGSDFSDGFVQPHLPMDHRVKPGGDESVGARMRRENDFAFHLLGAKEDTVCAGAQRLARAGKTGPDAARTGR